MTDLYSLCFRSRALLASSVHNQAANVADVLQEARRRNDADAVTSAIALDGLDYLQGLEGPRDQVLSAFERIRADRRHAEVTVLAEGPTRVRRFPGQPAVLVGHSALARSLLRLWSMSGQGNSEALADTLMAMLLADNAAEAQRDPAPASLDNTMCGREVGAAPLATSPESNPGKFDLAQDRDQAATTVPPELQALEAMNATALLTSDRRFIRANAAFHALVGYDRGALDGISLDVLIVQQDSGAAAPAWWASLAGREDTVPAAFRVMRGDGRTVELSIRCKPIRGADGRPGPIVMIATDVTAQVDQMIDERGQIAAIDRSQAVVHFASDGTVLHANARFLETMGYSLDEVVGRHHRMFVDPADAEGAGYAALWQGLEAGHHRTAECRRIGKNGRVVWLQASYHPLADRTGRIVKVVKYASDVTEEKLRQADFQWQITAIHKSHAVITFDMYGIILDANPMFLEAFGYKLEDVQGHHHRLFVEPSYAHSADYALFWRKLGQGHHQIGQYKRLARDGRDVWVQATYNPVFDMDGKPFKVVKYATIVTDEKLRQAEHQGQIAAIHKAQCVISFDLDGTITDANANFLAATGYRLAEVRGKHHRMFVEPEVAASESYRTFWRDLAAGKHQVAEYKRIGKDGREVWLQASYNPIYDMSGRPIKVVKYANDVTAEKVRQADYEGQIAAIQKSQGVISLSMDGVILDANAVFLESLGYRLDEVKGKQHSMLVEEETAGTADYAQFWQTLREGHFVSGHYRRVGQGGRTVWLRASYNPIFDLDGRPFKIVKIATDVTSDVALAEAYEDAKRQAQHDAATALPNRTRLAAFMASALATPDARLVVLYLDLDRFKPINDTFGHQVGDRVLGEIADRLRRSLDNDQLAARIGGDEFVVVAPGLKDDEIEAFCQRLMDVAAAPIPHDGGEIQISLSIGVAVSPSDGTKPDDLLRAADIALYRSKQNGRNTFCFFAAAMNDRIHAYRNLVDDMRRGLANNEFYLDYQPRFAARTQAIQSVEALVRWKHPVHGRISPADFIPLAERSGLIMALGTWVLRTACQAAAGWNGIGVSVNVSAVQFRDSNLVQVVSDALGDAGLDPSRLELELTEGVLFEDAKRAREALDGLKAIGVRLAMDDFGTGYSSLSSLRSFPFDVIKIDRQFVADMENRVGGREVVQAILGLGKALGLSVTAEGVETTGQLGMLAADACAEVQGYLLARPMSPELVSDLLAERAEAPDGLADRNLPPARDGTAAA